MKKEPNTERKVAFEKKDSHFKVNEMLDIEQEAKSIALQKQVLKKDSKLNKSLADTWSQHSELEEAVK